MWGVTPGLGGNVNQYQKINIGDLAMFHAEGKFFSCATVSFLLQNANLAERLWGRNPGGQTWEYMYALDELRSLDISHAEFCTMVGYRGMPRNVVVLDEEKSRAVLDRLPLVSRQYGPTPTADAFEEAVSGPDGELDVEVLAKRRTEQNYLRRRLFPTPEALCHLCGRKFDVEFLVAAHIKKRAACTDSERRDVSHAVMSACRFGCDELFERGFIMVTDDGKLNLSQALRPEGQAHAYASEHLSGKIFGSSIAGRESYFEWHRTHSYRG
jgi:hypothetical protein